MWQLLVDKLELMETDQFSAFIKSDQYYSNTQMKDILNQTLSPQPAWAKWNLYLNV